MSTLNELRSRPPLRQRRSPSPEQIRHIQELAMESKRPTMLRLLLPIGGAILAGVIILLSYFIVNEIPGGLADRKMSRALGSDIDLRIPLGDTAEDAVRKFRGNFPYRLVYSENIDGGALLFFKRIDAGQNTNLQLEYVRKTWLGWKWGWGGGYSIGDGTPDNNISYMSMPKLPGLRSPFPLIVGTLRNADVNGIRIEANGETIGTAKLTHFTDGETIWFAMLPAEAKPPFRIVGLDREQLPIAERIVDDPQDFGTIPIQ